MSYLITGASGASGRNIVSQLLAAGASVRVISRKPERAEYPAGVEVAGGDFAKGDFADHLFKGVTKVFVFPAEGGVDAFAAKASSAKIQQFVVLSSLAVSEEHTRDIASASNLHHARIEKAIKATGIPTTILRPGTFANNLLAWAPAIRAAGAVFGPYPTSAQAPIHEADVAAVAVATLLADGQVDHVYALTGPQALSRVEQLNAIGEALGRPLQFRETTPEQFRESMKQYMPDGIIKMLLDYWSDTVTKPDVVRPTVQEVTGKRGRTLSEWARDHVSDFR